MVVRAVPEFRDTGEDVLVVVSVDVSGSRQMVVVVVVVVEEDDVS